MESPARLNGSRGEAAGSRSNSNPLVCALLTDMYQLTMAYAYWRSGRHLLPACFELFFRKAPFNGQFALFAGLDEVLLFLEGFHFTDSDVTYLRGVMGECDAGFFEWLLGLRCEGIKVQAVPEGTVVFPCTPLMVLEGPLGLLQLLETPLLNLINYPSLVATNAARFKIAAGPSALLYEMGLRRAQGPDGGLTASRACYLGGFHGSSNALAGRVLGLPMLHTHSHAFIQAFHHNQLHDTTSCVLDGVDVLGKARAYLPQVLQLLHLPPNPNPHNSNNSNNHHRPSATSATPLGPTSVGPTSPAVGAHLPHEGELCALASLCCACPSKGLVLLLDTYECLRSGLPNAMALVLAMHDLGHHIHGVRVDSGDLAYLSLRIREAFNRADEAWGHTTRQREGPLWRCLVIMGSNDMNEPFLTSLAKAQTQPSASASASASKSKTEPLNVKPTRLRRQSSNGSTNSHTNGQSSASAGAVSSSSSSSCVGVGGRRHAMDAFAIGTHLVTCQAQSALGCVYKLVELCGHPRIKLSNESVKVCIPGKKQLYRLYDDKGESLADVLVAYGESLTAHTRLLCRHPYDPHKRCYITPAQVTPLLTTVFPPSPPTAPPMTASLRLEAARAHACKELQSLDRDSLRAVCPRAYKVCLSPSLFSAFHDLWDREANGHLPPSRQATPAPLPPPSPSASPTAPSSRGVKRPLDKDNGEEGSGGGGGRPLLKRHQGKALGFGVASAVGIAAVAYALLAHH